MSDVRLCPSCASRRMGAFRYCLSCRFDFDGVEQHVRTPTATAEPSWPDPEEARAAIRMPGFGAAPIRRPVPVARPGSRPTGIRWLTNAIASIGIVALIGVAFQSTGFAPLGAAGPPARTAAPETAQRGALIATPDPGEGTPTGGPAATPPGGTAVGPGSKPTTRPAALAPAPRVTDTPVAVTAAALTLRGSAGTATWTAIAFEVTEARLAWSATSERSGGCVLRWTLDRPNGKAVRGQVKVKGKAHGAHERTVKVKRGTGRLVVTTDCAGWSLVLSGTRQGG